MVWVAPATRIARGVCRSADSCMDDACGGGSDLEGERVGRIARGDRGVHEGDLVARLGVLEAAHALGEPGEELAEARAVDAGDDGVGAAQGLELLEVGV